MKKRVMPKARYPLINMHMGLGLGTAHSHWHTRHIFSPCGSSHSFQCLPCLAECTQVLVQQCSRTGTTSLEKKSCQGHGSEFSVTLSCQWLCDGSVHARELAEEQQWSKVGKEEDMAVLSIAVSNMVTLSVPANGTIIHLKVSENPNHSSFLKFIF